MLALAKIKYKIIQMNHSVVIGGSKGLGKAIAKKMISRGDMVSIISKNVPNNKIDDANYYQADLSNPESILVALQEIVTRGKINYLIFSQRYRGAGDSWVGEIEVSLTASKLIIDFLQDKFSTEDNAILFVSSAFAEYVGAGQPLSYHLGKAGMNTMMKHYAVLLGKQQIRSNCISPFTFVKEESEKYYSGQVELLEMYQKIVPLQRMGNSDEIADVALFLCSGQSRYISGQNIYVDGGLSAVWQESVALSMLK